MTFTLSLRIVSLSPAAAAAGAAGSPWPRPTPKPDLRASHYGLAVLFGVALFNYIDRSIIAILQEPLKADLKLSDTSWGR
jgi:hypothetical protein